MLNQQPQIGFIGIGIMGRPMALNLLKAGYQVTVHNRDVSKAEQLLDRGAKVAGSPAEVARVSDIAITMLPDTPDVEKVMLGENGVIEGAHEGLIVIDMSTISPEATKNIASKLKEKGVEMLDAPVSGGEKGAIEGTLTIMVGGKAEVFEKCIPVFQAMGKKITLLGDTPAGQLTKLGNQVVCSLALLGICEGLLLASKAGLNLDTFIEALLGGSAQSWLLANMGPKIAKRDFRPGFFVSLEQKDLRLVLEAAKENALSLPGTALVQQLYNAVEAEEGGARLGHHSLIRALEKLANFEIS